MKRSDAVLAVALVIRNFENRGFDYTDYELDHLTEQYYDLANIALGAVEDLDMLPPETLTANGLPAHYWDNED